MKDARFTIPTPGLLAKVVDLLDEVPMADRDTKGDLYEYMLGKIAAAGQNGQFRTPRHIIQLMVEMTAPTPTDTICDPACGTAGFLVAAGEYLRRDYPNLLHDAKLRAHFHEDLFHGFDFDNTMLRIGSMNMLRPRRREPGHPLPRLARAGPRGGRRGLHPHPRQSAVRGQPRLRERREGPPSDRQDEEDRAALPRSLPRLLKPGGRAAVIVPDGLLFGSSNAHKALRRMLVEEQKLDGVVSLPSGAFKPYAGVSTAILLFTKTNWAALTMFGTTTCRLTAGKPDDRRFPLLPENKLGPIPDSRLTEDELARNNLPDVLVRWQARDHAERERPRTSRSFCIPAAEIAEQGYDLSLNRYKERLNEDTEHRFPTRGRYRAPRRRYSIRRDISDLEAMLT